MTEKRKYSGGVVVKLGGSVITHKSAGRPAVRRGVIGRLAEEMASCGRAPLIIVHGAGSFGHTIVNKTRIDRKIEGKEGLRSWSKAQLAQNDLNLQVTSILLKRGIAAFACQPTGMVVLKAGRVKHLAMPALRGLVSAGLVPVLFGVPAFDEERECTILSGDVLAPALAHHLGIGLVVHATDVDGVFEADPAVDRKAARIPVVGRNNWRQVRGLLGGSRSIDVTGGMKGKVSSMVTWARKGVRARIVDATIPGRLGEALRGKGVGTLIAW
ncbi:MAG: isopentenyl phosphate kinase [Pseudomonadota bacterium]